MMTMDKWLPDTQRFIVQQEHARNEQALYAYGEYVIWYLLWNNTDFNDGLVGRCELCMVDDPIALNTYKQPTLNKCLDCFGTGYEGGYRARIVRPTLWTDTDEDRNQHTRRGDVNTNSHQVQASSDFTTHNGDIIVRADNSRWQVSQVPQSSKLLTGFGYRDKREAYLGYNLPTVTLEQKETVAYLIPPTDDAEVLAFLTIPSFPRRPLDFTDFEVIRASLLRT